jgi:hypothetical protein
MKRSLEAVVLAAVAGFACSGPTGSGGAGGSGGGSTGGTGGGGQLSGALAFPVANVQSQMSTLDDGGYDFSTFSVSMADNASFDVCTPAKEKFVGVAISLGDGGTLVPGTYPIAGVVGAPGYWGTVALYAVEVDGGVTIPAQSVSGSVTVTTLSSTRVTGTFTATMAQTAGGQSMLSGSYDCPWKAAVSCP